MSVCFHVRGVAQPGSALVLGTRGRRFESGRPDMRLQTDVLEEFFRMNRARIFLPPKSAMQSGRAKTRRWVLEFEPSMAKRRDPLMGWTGSSDMLATEVRLFFDSREEAIAYAERHGIPFDLEIPPEHHVRPKAYADNFRFNRRANWTH